MLKRAYRKLWLTCLVGLMISVNQAEGTVLTCTQDAPCTLDQLTVPGVTLRSGTAFGAASFALFDSTFEGGNVQVWSDENEGFLRLIMQTQSGPTNPWRIDTLDNDAAFSGLLQYSVITGGGSEFVNAKLDATFGDFRNEGGKLIEGSVSKILLFPFVDIATVNCSELNTGLGCKDKTGSKTAVFPDSSNFLEVADDISLVYKAFTVGGGTLEVTQIINSFQVAPRDVPEPATLLIFGTGMAGIIWRQNRKKKRSS